MVHDEVINEVTIETYPLNTLHHDQQSRDSDRTASVSGSTDSDKTPVRVDSQESQVSDTETITDGHRWPRQNSVKTSLKKILYCIRVFVFFCRCQCENGIYHMKN